MICCPLYLRRYSVVSSFEQLGHKSGFAFAYSGGESKKRTCFHLERQVDQGRVGHRWSYSTALPLWSFLSSFQWVVVLLREIKKLVYTTQHKNYFFKTLQEVLFDSGSSSAGRSEIVFTQSSCKIVSSLQKIWGKDTWRDICLFVSPKGAEDVAYLCANSAEEGVDDEAGK